MMKMTIRRYSDLIAIPTYEERFKYLSLKGEVGHETFGYDRYLNQILYNSPEWRRCRREIIIRDNGCDLACDDYVIHGKILIHHLNPITVDDIIKRRDVVFDPENLITTTHQTHNAIHYGNDNLLFKLPSERSINDTCPWKH